MEIGGQGSCRGDARAGGRTEQIYGHWVAPLS
jgi:hypothetical protein